MQSITIERAKNGYVVRVKEPLNFSMVMNEVVEALEEQLKQQIPEEVRELLNIFVAQISKYTTRDIEEIKFYPNGKESLDYITMKLAIWESSGKEE